MFIAVISFSIIVSSIIYNSNSINGVFGSAASNQKKVQKCWDLICFDFFPLYFESLFFPFLVFLKIILFTNKNILKLNKKIF